VYFYPFLSAHFADVESTILPFASKDIARMRVVLITPSLSLSLSFFHARARARTCEKNVVNA